MNTESLSYIEALSSGTCWFEGLRRTVVSSVPSSPPPLSTHSPRSGRRGGDVNNPRTRGAQYLTVCSVHIRGVLREESLDQYDWGRGGVSGYWSGRDICKTVKHTNS